MYSDIFFNMNITKIEGIMMFKKILLFLTIIAVCAGIMHINSINARGEAARGLFGGALGGATVGGIFGGGKGAAIGAGVGAGVGLISGAAAESNERRYNELYNDYAEYEEEPYYEDEIMEEVEPYQDYQSARQMEYDQE